MPRDRQAYLWDVLQAIALIRQFTSGKSFEDYTHDSLLRSGVERQLAIVGEALVQGSRYFPELPNSISDWNDIIAVRNRLVHGYAVISDAVIWGILENDLARLEAEAQALSANGSGI